MPSIGSCKISPTERSGRPKGDGEVIVTTVPETVQPVSAVERWRSMVEAERAQSARISPRAAGGPEQRWSQGRAEAFRADPRREGDSDVELIRSFVGPAQTLLDVGAGGGG